MSHGRVGMAADVSVLAMTADLGAEIRGIDLAAPLSDACLRRILDAFHRYGVIFLRGQTLDPRLLMRFAAAFGELAPPSGGGVIPGLPHVSVIADVGGAGRGAGSARCGAHWRTDESHLPRPPAATVCHVVQCPARGAGGMEFANQSAAFAALPREKRLLTERLRAVHDAGFRAGQRHPGVAPTPSGACEHPLVRCHPVTRTMALYSGKDIVSHVLGLAPAESRRLLDELESFATQPRFIYSHAWRKGDVLVWDNRCTLHRPTECDRRAERVLHRIRIRGEQPLGA